LIIPKNTLNIFYSGLPRCQKAPVVEIAGALN